MISFYTSLKKLVVAIIIISFSLGAELSNSVIYSQACTQTVTYCEAFQTRTATSCPNVASWTAEASLAPQYSSSTVDILGLFGGASPVISFSGFNFVIPSDKTVCRVEVAITRSRSTTGISTGEFVFDNTINVNGGANLAVGGNWPTTATAQVYNAGAGFTPASLNAGITLNVSVNAGATFRLTGSTRANLSSINATVYVSRQEIITVPCPLPIRLDYFRGEQNGACAQLSWKTESEIGVDHYIVEKMIGDSFVSIGTVKSKSGTNQTALYYDFSDCSVTDMNYYRLVQVDKNGKSELIGDITNVPMDIKFKDDLQLSPNPAHDYVVVGSKSAGREVQLIGMDGRVIKRDHLIDYTEQTRLDLSDCRPGIYNLVVTTSEGIFSKRLVVE